MKSHYTYHIDGLKDYGHFYSLEDAREWVADVIRRDVSPSNVLRGLWGSRRGDIIRTSENGKKKAFAIRKGGELHSK